MLTEFDYTPASGDIKAGAYLRRETNQRGLETNYSYNSLNGQLNSVTLPGGQVVSYAYKANTGLLSSVTQAGRVVSYTYNSTNTELNSITHNGFKYKLGYDEFGNTKTIKIGDSTTANDKTLVTNTYRTNNGLLDKVTYGNGTEYSYAYSKAGQVIGINIDGSEKYEFKYNSSGQATQHTDKVSGITYKYEYDSLGRLVRRYGDNGSIAQNSYDSSNNVTEIVNIAGGYTSKINYYYDEENKPTKLLMAVGSVTHDYTYDLLNRLSSYTISTTTPYDVSYVYMKADQREEPENPDAVYKTSLVSHETFGNRTYRYTYDDNNNITKIEERPTANGSYTTVATYTYDNAGQLVTEYNGYTGNTRTYTYDSGGNITKVVTTGNTTSTVNYVYDSTWKDKLVKYGDYEIETDDIGNPLTYRDGMSFTWQGRQMATANVGETAIEYKYNSDGLRTYKKVGTAEYEYEYLGDKLVYQKLGDTRLYFRYDVKGHLASVTRMKDDGSRWTVYAVCNTRGDVEELRSYSGDLYARYYYDAWGNVIKVTNKSGAELTSASEFALQNPIRYRGYQYDSETGLYYLNSRYYDPVTHRFVNADDFSLITANNNAITDKNLFAYCDNNPVMREDTGGDFWETAFDVISLGASVVDVAKNPKDIWAWAGFAGDFFDVVVPCIGGVGEAVKIAKASMKGADAVVDAVSTANKVDNAVDTAKTLHRPYIRKSVRQTVEDATPKLPDGRFLDANTRIPIDGKYDLGHIQGKEFWRMRDEAMAKGWTQKQFNDYMNNPSFYQIEHPSINRSHRFELR